MQPAMNEGPAMPADHFPAFLPPFASALKLAHACRAPSDFAALSATCQLAAIVARRAERVAEAVAHRHLASHLDDWVAAKMRG